MATFFSDSNFQPKRQFRFMVSFTELGNLTYLVTKAAKPSYKIGTKEHQLLNHQFKFPGIVKWDPVTIDFIDAVDPNVGSTFYAALLNAGYVAPGQGGVSHQDAITTGITKGGSTLALGEVRIKQLDGGGIVLVGDPGLVAGPPAGTNIVEEWTLKNAWLSEVSWGDLNYAEDGLVTITTKIEYDWAVYNPEVHPIPTG